MSMSWADRLELAISPFDLDDLIEELRKPKPEPEALQAASQALRLVKALLER